MSYLYGTALVPGAYHYGGAGLGVLGSDVPSEGDNGAGYLYNDLTLPADAGKEVRGFIEGFPSGLSTFVVSEDSSFSAAGPDGVYAFTYRLYVDGVDAGAAVVMINIGASLSGAVVLDDFTANGLLAPEIPAVIFGDLVLDDFIAEGIADSLFSILSGSVVMSSLVASGNFVDIQRTPKTTYTTNEELRARYE